MGDKSIKPPDAFMRFAERMFQDAEFFDTLEDLLRFCLQGIVRDQLGDFIAFVKRIENREMGDQDLEKLWRRSGADMGYSAPGLRIFLTRARKMAEEEGLGLYRKKAKRNSYAKGKDLF